MPTMPSDKKYRCNLTRCLAIEQADGNTTGPAMLHHSSYSTAASGMPCHVLSAELQAANYKRGATPTNTSGTGQQITKKKGWLVHGITTRGFLRLEFVVRSALPPGLKRRQGNCAFCSLPSLHY